MVINSLKDLKQVLALCRKQGVTSIKLGDLELTLGALPKAPAASLDYSNDFPEASIPVPKYQPVSDDGKVLTNELTPNQLMFYSAIGPTDQLIGEQ